MSVRRIAALTGLSPSAVSLALRHSRKIPEETRQRVRRAAERIGYRPNARAAELMSALRLGARAAGAGCFGVISLYPERRPWEESLHLRRIHLSMVKRADELGYRLEPLWLKEPGMSARRLRSILEARAIEGLLCFGSDRIDEEFPRELTGCAVVTIGLSIHSPLHRVASHAYNDINQALEQVRRRGYDRPGLVLGNYEEARSALAYSSGYLGWCEHHLKTAQPVPILRMDRIGPETLKPWLRAHRPDALVVIDRHASLGQFQSALAALPLTLTRRLGVTAVSQLLEGTGLAGVQQNQDLMGAWAVELLTARLQHRDLGLPRHPRIELVEGQWVEGSSLPLRRSRR